MTQTKIKLIKYLRELEEFKRKEKKKWLYETGYKVYKQGIVQRMNSKMFDMWEDGEEIVINKRRLLEIMQEKNGLEKEWNKVINQKKVQVKENSETKIMEKIDEEDRLKLINHKMLRLASV